MNAKTMEGIVGASTNINMAKTPLHISKKASRKGDMATMERAMGYVNELKDKAEQYKSKADEGMKEDAKEAREKAKLEQEKAIQKHKEEREKLEARMEESRKDKVEISEDGKVLLKENTGENADFAGTVASEPKTDVTETAKKPVAYTQNGDVINLTEQKANISVSL